MFVVLLDGENQRGEREEGRGMELMFCGGEEKAERDGE